MQTLQELGGAVAARRKALNLRQQVVAVRAGITPESLSRFERGRCAEFGARKLLASPAARELQQCGDTLPQLLTALPLLAATRANGANVCDLNF